MKKILLFCFVLISTCQLVVANVYQIDFKKSQLNWEGKKITNSKHNGTINFQSGILKKEKGKITGEFIIDMNTIKVLDIKNPKHNKKLKDHLMSDDFFATNKYNTSIFKITSIKKQKKQSLVEGILTIKGIEKKISFPADIQFGKKSFSASGKIEIDRTLYNIRYGSSKFFKKLKDKVINDNFHLDFKIIGNLK